MLEDLVRMKRTDGVEQALARIAESCFPSGRQAGWGLRAALATLPIPTQTIWGAQDRVIPAQHSAGLAHATIIEDAGHMVHIEKPATVNDLLRRLIAGEP
jgi:pyruvate dehydrogenase E2 component (dihydrolipoamide acetyltransferase)